MEVKVTRVVTSTPVIDVPPPTKSHVAYTALLWYSGVVQLLLTWLRLAEGMIRFRIGSSTVTAKLAGNHISMLTCTTHMTARYEP